MRPKTFITLLVSSLLLLSCTGKRILDERERDLKETCSENEHAYANILRFNSINSLENAIDNNSLVDSYGQTLRRSDITSLRSANELAQQERLEYLVPEKAFRDLLNLGGEVIVEDTLYIINEAGTYFAHIKDANKLHLAADSFELGVQDADNPKIYKIGSVYRYDTFKIGDDSSLLNIDVVGHNLQTKDVSLKEFREAYKETARSLIDDYYDSPFPDVSRFGSKNVKKFTIVGKLTQGVGIRNSVIVSHPDYKNQRLNATIFDYDYKIKYSIGANAKMQWKIWYGAWFNIKDMSSKNLMLGLKNSIIKMSYPKGFPPFWMLEDYVNGTNRGVHGQKKLPGLPLPIWESGNGPAFPLSEPTVIEAYDKDLIYKRSKEIFENHLSKLYANRYRVREAFKSFEGDNFSSFSLQDKEFLSRYPIGAVFYAPDGIYISMPEGYYLNNSSDEGNVTIHFMRGMGTIKFGFKGNIHDPNLSDFNGSIDSAKKGSLIDADFYACFRCSRGWEGINMMWK